MMIHGLTLSLSQQAAAGNRYSVKYTQLTHASPMLPWNVKYVTKRHYALSDRLKP